MSQKRGFTLIELLVVIAIIAILASILFPVFAKAREQARKATCISQVRQIATAVQMYIQDNGGQYPGVDGGSWVSKLATYMGNSDKMFACPSDSAKDVSANSYAFAGILIRPTGQGVKESNVASPSEVGCVVDAGPTETYPSGRLIGGGAGQAIATNGADIELRHSKGAVAGFCDGHAKYYQGGVIKNDAGNGLARAFYQGAALGLVNNPMAFAQTGYAIAGVGDTVIGGEFCQVLGSAANVAAGGKGLERWKGGGNTTGFGDDNLVMREQVNVGQSAIAYVGMTYIVAKTSKIPGIGTQNVGNYAMGTAAIRALFANGTLNNTATIYTLSNSDLNAISNAFLALAPSFVSTDAVPCDTPAELLNAVANDPYGIGVISSVYVDIDRVSVIAPVIGATTYWYLGGPGKYPKREPLTYAELSLKFAPGQRLCVVPVATGTNATLLRDALTGAWRDTMETYSPLWTVNGGKLVPGNW